MIKPYGDYILIEIDIAKEEKTESGIYLPEKKTDTPSSGVVLDTPSSMAGEVRIKAGGESELTQHVLHKGVKVWFKMWAGEVVEKTPEKEIKLVHLKDIIGYEISSNK